MAALADCERHKSTATAAHNEPGPGRPKILMPDIKLSANLGTPRPHTEHRVRS